MKRMIAWALVLLAGLQVYPAAGRDLDPPGVSKRANGDVVTQDGYLLGKAVGGKFTATPDTVQIGATGAFWTSVDPAYLASLGIPQPAKVGARIHRMSDRLLVGAAVQQSGDYPPSTRDWYEALEAGETHPGGFRTSWAQFASISTNGGIGVLGAARTSDIELPTFQLAMGGLFAAHNNNTTSQQLATALYAVTFRDNGAGQGLGTGSVAFEADIQNKGNSLKLTPANVDDSRGHTTAAKLNSGAAVPGSNAASAALTFGNNRGQFLTGLIVAQNAIAGVNLDGTGKAVSGEGEAIALGAYQGLTWWVTGGSTPSAKIISRQLTAANTQEISFEDTGIYLGGPAGAGRALRVNYPGGATGAYVAITPATGSVAPVVQAAGATNSDLRLEAAGAGMIVWDRPENTSTTASAGTSAALPGPPAGYTKVRIGGVTRKFAYWND